MVNYGLFQEAKDRIKKGDYVGAKKLFKKLNSYEPHDNNIKFEYAKSLIRLGNFNEAQVLLEELQESDNWIFALLELAKINVRYRKYDLAFQQMNTILEYKPDDKFTILELSRLYAKQGQYQDAISGYSKLLTTSIKENAIFEIGNIYLEINEYEKAEDMYKRLKDTNYKYLMYKGLGYSNLKKGNKEQALENLKKSVNIKNNVKISTDIAKIYFEKEMYYDAEIILENINMFYNYPEAIFILGKIKRENKDINGSLNEFEKLIGTTMEKYALFEKAKTLLLLDNVVEAQKIFNTLWIENKDINSLLELAKHEMLYGNMEKAKELIYQNHNCLNDPYYLRELIKIENDLGNINEALRLIDVFKKNNDEKYVSKTKAYILIKKDVKEAYDYYLTVKDIIKDDKAKRDLEAYLKIKNNIELNRQSYFVSQIKEYNEELAINHIMNHKEDIQKKKRHGIFKNNVEVRSLYYNVKELIENLDPTFSDISDKYLITFEYPVGEHKGNDIYRLVVVTETMTKNILTMFPSNVFLEEDYEKNSEVNSQRVKKRESQIDKFNRRYGKQ